MMSTGVPDVITRIQTTPTAQDAWKPLMRLANRIFHSGPPS
eukprot:CAMPEP_0116123350 /NCGR_PEP_ID=MMETSP0329-20121206/4701_1 /TAXON_ID=697910 /ORGANISM="Pseudo-nitzschia arenysensis, Strain B593" /LENGTH=40 /DNA_ID= /DNA_START= /DNA_END= /DNA_ORIENTATION=